MNINNPFMTGSHHTFKSALLRSLLLLCMIPAPAKAQLFGGTIKTRPIIPSNLTLGQNMTYFVASVYDEDYLPYLGPDGVASTEPKAANGVNETLIINELGTITTSGVTVVIPVTATGSGTLLAYSATVTVDREKTQDDTSRDLMLSWASQPYTATTKWIPATIAAVDGPLNVKKLDISGGLGTDYSGIELGQLVYPYNNAGITTTYTVRAIPGIPDKMFGQYDLGSTTTYQHNFLYCPVTGEDGKIWLNNNLGADYSNINRGSFNPNQQATAYNDYRAYGSLFQWGRAPDGHELISWSGSGTGTVKYTYTEVLSDAPLTALFISTVNDWRVTKDDYLWQGKDAPTNPCPTGYRLPSWTETLGFYDARPVEGRSSAAQSMLRLTCQGTRLREAATLDGKAGIEGGFWVAYGTTDSFLNTVRGWSDAVSSGTILSYRGVGHGVRCIKD